MTPGSELLDPAPHAASPALPAGVAFLSIDVESHPGEGNRIFRLAAVRSDRKAVFDAPVPSNGREAVARRMTAFAAGADILVGHNLRRHDLRALAAQFLGLDWLHLPIIDTLELSPLVFPRNPYHRLVKGYKLVSDSRNHPVGDARLALELLACFTATAKPDVVDDLLAHFRDQLGVELQRFLGGHERANLEYVVVPMLEAEKGQHILKILTRELRDGGAGIVFCAKRDHTEIWAEQLARSGLRCRHFHAGLDAGDKKKIQQDFIAGGLDVIVATNAFGMGVDKDNVRVVVHADIPGWLENHLQEAGRAGRGGFLKRNENRSRVFPTSLRIPALAGALARIRAASLTQEDRQCYEAVAAALYRCETPDGLSTDDLQLAAGIDHKDCFRILCGLEQLGILANDLGLTALASKGVQGASDRAFERLVHFERALLDLMSESAPDAAIDDAPQLLGVRAMCSELRQRLDLPAGHPEVNPARLHKCLRVELHRGWREIREICAKRQAAARCSAWR